jgi:hypothetical protein
MRRCKVRLRCLLATRTPSATGCIGSNLLHWGEIGEVEVQVPEPACAEASISTDSGNVLPRLVSKLLTAAKGNAQLRY